VVPKYRLLTPGPVPEPEAVREAMARTVLHHRAPEFLPVLEQVRRDLKSVFQTEREVLILATSGTGAMEAAVANAFSAGDRVVVVRGGKFGARWAELCEAYGVEALCVDVEWGRAVEPEAVRAAFTRAPDARALLVQASETSTGVYHPIRELCELVHEQPERLMVVDGISGVGVHDLPMDAWGIDVLVSGSQKSWMLPPGMAFIALSEGAERALGLELFAPDAPAFSCTAVKAPEGVDSGELIRRLRDVYGITLAGGQGQAAGKVFRVGHMGDVDGFDILSAIAALEMALADLGVPVKVGEGTRTATEILRDLLSEEVH